MATNDPIHISLPTPFPVGPANAYLFIDPEPTLVDCGVDTDESWYALESALAEQSLTVADIQRVIVTHAHVDHMGMAGRICAHSNANVLMWEQIAPWADQLEMMWSRRVEFLRTLLPQYDLPDLQRDSIVNGMSGITAIWSPVPKDRVRTFSLDDKLSIGAQNWDLLYLPGHSNTQTCFFQPETGHFLAADMLLPLTPAPVLEYPLGGKLEREPSLPRMFDSFDTVYDLPIEQVYPGHGEPFTDHRSLIDHQRTRIQMRKAECLELIGDGKHQVGEMLNVMYSHHPETARFTGLSMLIGYLDLLLEDGEIREEIVDGKRRYFSG